MRDEDVGNPVDAELGEPVEDGSAADVHQNCFPAGADCELPGPDFASETLPA